MNCALAAFVVCDSLPAIIELCVTTYLTNLWVYCIINGISDMQTDKNLNKNEKRPLETWSCRGLFITKRKLLTGWQILLSYTFSFVKQSEVIVLLESILSHYLWQQFFLPYRATRWHISDVQYLLKSQQEVNQV